MASTLNLQQTLLWSGPYVHFQPLAIGGTEPAISNANLIKQTILGAPFAWPWNRAESAPIQCAIGVQDYPVYLPLFGFIEKAWVTLAGDTKEIEVNTSLAKGGGSDRPTCIAVQYDDNAGNITFRLLPPPDQAYKLTVQYQQSPSPIISLASRWSPIPDELSYIFQYGFLALALMITGDARFPIFNDRFVAHLLGAQDGLDELQRNIFIGAWLSITKQAQRAQGQAQQGTASRGK